MKTLITILLLAAFTGIAQHANAQRGDFSDWNVPPPILPGSIGKGATGKTVIPPLTDVPAPSMPKIDDVLLAALEPVSKTAPEVNAPERPEFPDLPFKTVDIPSPSVPEAMGLPKQVFNDDLSRVAADLPALPIPEMPDLPKMPVVLPGKYSNTPVPIPIIPDLLKQPNPGDLSSNQFPFIEWSIPTIPSNAHFELVLPGNKGGIRLKPKTSPKLKKTHKRRN